MELGPALHGKALPSRFQGHNVGKAPEGNPLCRVGKPEALSLNWERSPQEKGEPRVCSKDAAPMDSAFSSSHLTACPVGGFLTKISPV